MPRVTDAHRQARRDEIAEAAVRVLQRRGVSSTSIAQIVKESGLSAGAIYANFENKAELAKYIAQSLLDWRVGVIDEGAGTLRTPADVLRSLLVVEQDDVPPLALILQFWGEATMDEELHDVLEAKVTQLRGAFERAILPWAETRSPDDAAALAHRAANTMIVMAQGYMVNTALLGWVDAGDYLDTATAMLA